MSEGPFSITDIINENTNKETISPIPPIITYGSNYILIDSKHFEQPEKKVIIYTGAVLGGVLNKESKSYYLKETIDDGYIEIYSKSNELTDIIRCKILSDIGYKKPSEGCNMMGGKRKRRRTKKNKKRKSKKCKSKRRRRK